MHLGESLETFFRNEVAEALRAEGLPSGGPTQPYLVKLLAAYAAQPIENRPLGLQLLQARQASPRERRSRLREIGDTSLFLSGFWGDSLGGKLVDVDYYISLGGMAYAELAGERERDAPERERACAGIPGQRRGEALPTGQVFTELAAHFPRFVGVLMTIRHRTSARARSDRDIVRLYERWMRTRSGWAARRLVEEGVIAVKPSGGPGGTLH
jgi:hypothetical protein